MEHSDGEVRLQKGTMEYDEAGNLIGVSIWVDKFSTFTLVNTSFKGTTKVIQNKQMPDKTWAVTFGKKIDSATVTEDTIYLLDSKGNKVDLKLECKANKIKIIPVSYYKAGETYTLYITQNVLYESGTAIEKARKYTFTTANITLTGTKLKSVIKIDKKKACYINLGQTIDTDTIKSKNVTVVDQTGKKIQANASVVLEKNAKGTTVDKPDRVLLIKFEGSLQKGKTYYILIKDVEYKKGNIRDKAVWIKFTVSE